ncbi:MAG: DUF2769 domain-containing protein [Planctomycetota bacterium]|jgi:hypothetical protein
MPEVEDTEENFQICIRENCGTCPSYAGVEGEALYCARSRSKSAVQRVECRCPDCPVWVNYGLGRTFYCDQ